MKNRHNSAHNTLQWMSLGPRNLNFHPPFSHSQDEFIYRSNKMSHGKLTRSQNKTVPAYNKIMSRINLILTQYSNALSFKLSTDDKITVVVSQNKIQYGEKHPRRLSCKKKILNSTFYRQAKNPLLKSSNTKQLIPIVIEQASARWSKKHMTQVSKDISLFIRS